MFNTDQNVKNYLKEVKLVSLTREGKYKEGNHFMHSNAKILKHEGNAFVDAYLLYKLGKYNESLVILKKYDGKVKIIIILKPFNLFYSNVNVLGKWNNIRNLYWFSQK